MMLILIEPVEVVLYIFALSGWLFFLMMETDSYRSGVGVVAIVLGLIEEASTVKEVKNRVFRTYALRAHNA